ncbi:MAG: hypothetical protein ACR2OO_01020 [Thermomicrobiales bacterium]
MTITQSSAMDRERKKQRALQRLGMDDPRCMTCGEADWRCLERHHIAGRAYDEHTVILCRNCHRKLSDPSGNGDAAADPPLLERVGRFLLGLAALLLMLAAKFKTFGDELLAAARYCPAPYGWNGGPA